jgi:hypothetical protein
MMFPSGLHSLARYAMILLSQTMLLVASLRHTWLHPCGLSISSRGHNPLENTRATPRSVCHHHRHGLHPRDVLTHVVSIIITIIIIYPSHMAWARPTWSCKPVASPELHRLSHDHPDHITSNTIIAIQVLNYATSVPDCLTSVATTRHTRPSH